MTFCVKSSKIGKYTITLESVCNAYYPFYKASLCEEINAPFARVNANSIARKNADGYIKYNPQDKDRRNRDLQIEICGIDNLYYRILKEIERIENL